MGERKTHHDFMFSWASRPRDPWHGMIDMFLTLLCKRNFSNLSRYSDLPNNNAKIRACVQQGSYLLALQLYSLTLTSSLLPPDKFTFPSLLKACAALFDLNHGKIIHGAILQTGFQSDSYIATSLINMYVKCGSLSDAYQVFDKMSQIEILEKDVTIWNAMINGYFKYGRRDEGVDLFRRMILVGVRSDGYSLSIVLGSCSDSMGIEHGKQIHCYVVRNGFDHDPFLDTALVGMYAKCGSPMDAWEVFDGLSGRNVIVWNAMIGGFCENGLWERSLELFKIMKSEGYEPGSATYSSVLTACSCGEAVSFGTEVHCDVIKIGFECDPYVFTSLLAMYGKCWFLEDAYRVFDEMPDRGTESWNAMISAYLGNGCINEALDMYKLMKLTGCRSDSFSISNVLSACSMIELLDFGRGVHGELIKRPIHTNVAVQSALSTMYAKCGNIEEANSVFCKILERDIVSWGSMITGFCQNGKIEDALDLFKAMMAEGLKPDYVVAASMISSFTSQAYMELGLVIHGFVIKSGTDSDVFVGSALIDMYAKHGLPELAESVFSGVRHKNLVVWNSIISGYGKNGYIDRSISLFAQIPQHGLIPDSVSITSVLVAISSLAALLKGKMIHGFQIRRGIQSDFQVENTLIDMYVKCGCLKYAHLFFNKLPQRTVVAWNSLIAGYGSHGECLKAIGLFDEMQKLGLMPDDITFLSLITSCSHSGFVEEGFRLFQSMKEDYGILPRMDHYANMVDLLGRAGRLNEAVSFIQNMPIKPDRSVWLCLLCACRVHHHIELGELAADHLQRLEPERGSNYVQLLNLYGEAELWDKVANLRVLMKEKGLKKSPGCSWIEVKNRVDVFFSGDSSSPRTIEIHATLKSLRRNMAGRDGFDEIAIL